MKVNLSKLYKHGKEIKNEKIKPIQNVDIDLNKDSNENFDVAFASSEYRIIDKLVFAHVKNISMNGLLIVGLEEHFVDGVKGYYYQEWWCIPAVPDPIEKKT